MAKSPFVTAVEAATGKKAKPKFEPDLTAISERYGIDRGIVGGIGKTLAGASVAAGGVTYLHGDTSDPGICKFDAEL